MLKTLKTPGDTSWFTHDRFGLFIHWGLYALPARHEWIKAHETMSDEHYDRYFRRFDPDLYDPQRWAATAAAAGMKYFVITTKHHEGFCLWDTKLTDYKAPNTPAGRDLLRPMVESFRAQNMRVGFYHSLIDWHHPHYVIDPCIGPLRAHPDREKLNRNRRQKLYAEYLRGQVRELLTDFGKIDVMWFDFSYPRPDGSGKGRKDWESEKIYRLVRELQPHIILNDRLDLDSGWDVKTPEQVQPREWVRVDGKPVVWEACQTFSGSWGYHREEATWKSVEDLVKMLVDTVSKGGNLLLNVGPTGRGEFDERAMNRLEGIGEWMRRHQRAIYGCTQAPRGFTTPRDCRLTYNPEKRRMYLHVFSWPFRQIQLEGFSGKIEYAQLLHDASEIIVTEPANAGHCTLNLPVVRPPVTVPVIEIFLK